MGQLMALSGVIGNYSDSFRLIDANLVFKIEGCVSWGPMVVVHGATLHVSRVLNRHS